MKAENQRTANRTTTKTTPENTAFRSAINFLKSGYCVIPVKSDGTKAPAVSWHEFQQRKPTLEEVRRWWGNGNGYGVAVIGGTISGGLEIIDIDDGNLIPEFTELVEEACPGLMAMLPRVRTPKGLHVYFRHSGEPQGNQKLAMSSERQTAIETRGEAGYVISIGSPAACHPSGKTYEKVEGSASFRDIPILTSEQRDLLLTCARSFNKYIPPQQRIEGPKRTSAEGEGLRPGDDFNQRGDVRALLEKHRWKYLRNGRLGELWQRPDGLHTSGTLFPDNSLYVFSSNAMPFEMGRAYSPFAIYATLEHGGDFTEAVKALAADGYGEQKKKQTKKKSNTAESESDSEPDDEASDERKVNGYTTRKGCLTWLRPTADSKKPQEITLANFEATITADVLRDDGTDAAIRCFEITGKLADGGHTRTGTVTAAEFPLMKWPVTLFGARAIIFPNRADHARTAIQSLIPDDITEKRIVIHTGWRVEDGKWVYCHAAGAIGADGQVAVTTSLPPALRHFVLPDPPSGDDLKISVDAVIQLLNAAPVTVTASLLGAAFCVVTGSVDFSPFVAGETQSCKSSVAALVQNLFGAGFDKDNLPGNWSSTANASETLAHTGKDAYLVLDDYVPSGTPQDVARLHMAAERLFRGQGNSSGRMRLTADGSMRQARAPRGVLVGTGEDIPPGASLRARLWILEMKKGVVKPQSLTRFQRLAREGVYASAMSAFLQWLAQGNRIAEIQEQAADELDLMRSALLERFDVERQAAIAAGCEVPEDINPRALTTMSHLLRGWRTFLDFAVERGAMTEAEDDVITARVWDALLEAARAQRGFQETENPTLRFIDIIRAALSSGKAHLASDLNKEPDSGAACGWREGNPQGDRIGWVKGSEIYLIPDAAFSVYQRFNSIPLTQQTLWKRCRDAGHLASTQDADRLKIKKVIEGVRYTVLSFKNFLDDVEKQSGAQAGK